MSPDREGKWEPGVQARQETIRAAYLAQAEELERGTADEYRLARDIRSFVAGMPVPLTGQQLLASELKLSRNKAASPPPHRSAPHGETQQHPNLHPEPLLPVSPPRIIRRP